MNSAEALAHRVTSAANVSVGTTIAMETIIPGWPVFDPARVAPPKVSLHGYNRVMFNLWTLARNLLASVPREERDKVLPQDAGEVLAEEAWEVVSAVEKATAGAVKGLVYFPSYKGLEREYPKGRIRKNTTDKQKASQAMLEGMCEVAAKILETNHKASFARYDVQLRPEGFGTTMILTHFPSDLLSEHRMGKVTLLESHTGVVKPKNLWYTKLFNGKTMSNMPFNAMTLQVFGDDHHFHPWEPKIKNAILEMAQKNRWSWATTSSRIRLDVRSYPDALFAKALIDLL